MCFTGIGTWRTSKNKSLINSNIYVFYVTITSWLSIRFCAILAKVTEKLKANNKNFKNPIAVDMSKYAFDKGYG